MPNYSRLLTLAAVACAAASFLLLARAAQSTADITLIPAAKVTAGFAKGGPLLETADYKIHSSRREAPGEAEIHAADTDIFHILEGSAVIVTGGALSDPRTEGPGETRGKGITGGKPQRLQKGDVIIIPAGMPHWFKEVTPPLLYYTVKVTRQPGK